MEKTKTIYQKLLEIQNEGLTFAKTAENPYFRSKYLPLEELQKKLAPQLEKHKLLVIHYSEGGAVVTAVIDTESEGKIESHFPLQANLDPQKVGSAISYAKRYNLGQLFNIITDVDDDAEKATDRTPKYTPNTAKKDKKIDLENEAIQDIGLEENDKEN